MFNFSPDQQAAFDAVREWLDASRRKTLSLGGYAGTGKSTLVKHVVDIAPRAVVCAPTGKAAHVLRSKGVDAQTLHSLIYTTKVVRNKHTGALEWRFTLTADRFALVIVDEASMLSTRLVRDLEIVADKVLYVGDHGQLQPIQDDPEIMHDPDLRLENIHRQAEGSDIIEFAHARRRGEYPRTVGDAARVQVGRTQDLAGFDVVLCGYNKTRVRGNAWIREQRGFTGKLPQVGEQVICLANDAERGVFNGMICTVMERHAGNVFTVQDDAGEVYHELPFDPQQFGRTDVPIPRRGVTLWDFGYVVTVHKSQGSEWPRVAVLDQVASSWSAERWRYTAATRASEELRWVL